MMNNKMNKPARFTGEMYGLKVVVEHEYSDVSLDVVMDAFETILTGMGYHPDALKDWIVERAEEYNEQANQSEDLSDWDVTLNDGLEDEDDYIENPEWAVVDVINKLKQLEVDGEVMQFILEQVGMDEQMAIQLATMYPDVVEEHLAELKAEIEPYVSDNFQIGPEGAYEHEEGMDEDEEYSQPNQAFINAFQNYIKTMKANTKNGK
jgi:hypothetical protein